MAPPFAFGTYSILAMIRNTTPLTAATAYTSLTILSLLCQAAASVIDAIMGLIQALTSLERIREYLALEGGIPIPDDSCSAADSNTSVWPLRSAHSNEKVDDKDDEKSVFRPSISEEIDSSAIVTLRNCSAGWDRSSRPVINDVDATVRQGSFVVVIGPVGSGKSSLLHTILGEIPHTTGTIILQDVEASFCSQSPWLINATIKENIVGHSMFDIQWYNTVVRSCALDHDFTQLPGGENATIGSKGIMLSGGQKGRLVIQRLYLLVFVSFCILFYFVF